MLNQISDKRKHQLAYCKICDYRDLDIAKGITCALTKDVADFEKKCPSMRIDFEEVEGQEIDLHNAILDHIRKNYDLLYLKKEHYILPNYPFYSKYYSKKNTQKIKIEASNFDNNWTVIALMSSIIFAIIMFNTTESIYILLLSFLTLISFGFFLIRLVIDYYSPAGIRFSTDEQGFILDGTRIYWHDIVDFRIIYTPRKEGCRDLIIGTISEGVQSFNIKDLRLTIDQLLEIFSLNRVDYLTRYDRNLPDII